MMTDHHEPTLTALREALDALARGGPDPARLALFDRVRDRQLAPELADGLARPEPAAREAALRGLVALGGCVVPLIAERLAPAPPDPEHAAALREALWTLAEADLLIDQIERPDDYDPLEALAGWLPEDVRAVELDPLAQNVRRAGPALGAAIANELDRRPDPSALADAGAALALGLTSGPEAPDALLAIAARRLEDRDAPFAARRALIALTWLAPARAIETAAAALAGAHHRAAAALLLALGAPGTRAAAERALGWGDDAMRAQRTSAIRVLSGDPGAEASEALTALADDPAPHVRHLALRALARRAEVSVLERLTRLAEHSDLSERGEALDILAEHPDEAARAALMEARARAVRDADAAAIDDLDYLIGAWDERHAPGAKR